MTLEDIKKLATGSLLFSLDRIIAPRMINIVYLLGLAGLVLWAISHFFATFGYGFGNGLWGLLEIAVFGLLGFVVLRIVCEALIVYFRANEKVVQAANQPRPSVSLIDEVRDAIEELAEEEEDDTVAPATSRSPSPPAKTAAPAKTGATAKTTTARKTPRRTAKRTPPRKPGS